MLEVKDNPIAENVYSNFKYFSNEYLAEGFKINVSHFGVFSQDLVNSLVEGNETLMTSLGDFKQAKKRMFSILIEGLQNVRKHAAKDLFERQIAFLLIAKNELIYKVNFGNIILNKDVELIRNKIDYINSLSNENLKIYYLKELSENVFSEKNGAGLGFIIMKMKSDNLLNYKVDTIDSNYSFLSLEVLINKV